MRPRRRSTISRSSADLQAQFLATIPEVDPTTRVPWCGRWRVEGPRRARRPDPPLGRGPGASTAGDPARPRPVRPDGPLPRRARRSSSTTLTELGPDASFVDARSATDRHRSGAVGRPTRRSCTCGTCAPPVGSSSRSTPVVWADTVDEVVTVMQPRQERLGRMEPLPAPVALHATDADRTWLLGGDTRARRPRARDQRASSRSCSGAGARPTTRAARRRRPAAARRRPRAPADPVTTVRIRPRA